MRKARCARSSVFEALQSLDEAGELRVDRAKGSGKVNRYAILLPIPDPSGERTRGGPESGPEPSKEPSNGESAPAPAFSSVDEARALYPSLPSTHQRALAAVVRVAEAKKRPVGWKPRAVVVACEQYADRDLAAEAEAFEGYWIETYGENRPMKDPVATWRNWLKRAPTAEARRRAGKAVSSIPPEATTRKFAGITRR
jgi:hypothetical protein